MRSGIRFHSAKNPFNPLCAGKTLKAFCAALSPHVVIHALWIPTVRPAIALVGLVRGKIERADHLFDELEKFHSRFATRVFRNLSNCIDDSKQIMTEIAQTFPVFVSRGFVQIGGVIQSATIGKLAKPHTFKENFCPHLENRIAQVAIDL